MSNIILKVKQNRPALNVIFNKFLDLLIHSALPHYKALEMSWKWLSPTFGSLLNPKKERFNQNAVRTIEACHNRTSFAKIRKKVTEQFLRKWDTSVEICHFRHKNGRRFKTNDSSHIIFGEHTHTDIYVAHAKLEKKLLNSFWDIVVYRRGRRRGRGRGRRTPRHDIELSALGPVTQK